MSARAKHRNRGIVFLVGAGPGAPDLITLRGADALGRADVVIYDHLVSPELIRLAPPKAELIYAGKKGGAGKSIEQSELNAMLIERARMGRVVIRLKGGDPFIFARGGAGPRHDRYPDGDGADARNAGSNPRGRTSRRNSGGCGPMGDDRRAEDSQRDARDARRRIRARWNRRAGCYRGRRMRGPARASQVGRADAAVRPHRGGDQIA